MYTVVVADDEEELRKALIRKVDWENVGFSVVGEAENGAEALELVGKYEPDLLLTDIRMPYMSGIELARQVREIRPTTQIAFLSGFDDFSYAQQAIQYNIISYMLKPISSVELTEELGKIRIKIDEKFREFTSQKQKQEKNETIEFLMPLMLDGFRGSMDEEKENELRKEAVIYGLFKDMNHDFRYTVMVTSIIDEEGRNCTSHASVNAIDTILKKYVHYFSFFSGGRVVSLIMATQGALDKYLHILVEEIDQSVKRIMKLSSSIGISRPVSKLLVVHEAYIEAMNAMSYSKRNGSSVHFISDLERSNDLDFELVQTMLTEVERLIRSGSRQELKDYLMEMFDTFGYNRISQMAINFALMQLSATVIRVVYAVSDSDAVQELNKHMPPQMQMLYENLEETRNRYVEFCMYARELISEQRKKSSTVICDRAMEVIECRYMDQELSLVSISSEIGVSPNYLSALIKKTTGSTFVDLLTKKRIETARKLLFTSSMKIKEISEKCGYNDQHYFSYCFKKYTGTSPNTCRRNNGQGENN